MNRPLTLLTLLTLTFLAAIQSHAGEGFFSKKDLPPQLLSAWEATFLIQSPEGDFATAFLVDKHVVSSRRVWLLFLTSDHLVQGNCKKTMGYCPNIAKLSASEGVHGRSGNPILMDHKDHTIREVAVVDRQVGGDVALLGAIGDREKYESIQPIPLIPDCNSLYVGQESYLIGFPNISTRTAPGALPIEKKHHIIRRGSQGHLTTRVYNDNYPDKDQQKFHWTGTTADALPGNSGGPALTSRGEFFGVLHGMETSESGEDDNRFIGGEEGEWHSRLTNCQFVEDFLSH